MWRYERYQDVLCHYGIKGMKWGVRRFRNMDGTLTPAGKKRYAEIDAELKELHGYRKNPNKAGSSRFSTAIRNRQIRSLEKEKARMENPTAAKAERRKKAIKVGAIAVGSLAAAYGTYKVAKYIQEKRDSGAMKKAKDYLDQNLYEKYSESIFGDGTRQFGYRTRNGNEIVTGGARNVIGKQVGKMNAKTIATAKDIYNQSINTKFDRGIGKVVDAGDRVGAHVGKAMNTAGKAASAGAKNVGNAARKAKNNLLDVVNPIYEYVPSGSRTESWKPNEDNPIGLKGANVTRTITEYTRKKKKRL